MNDSLQKVSEITKKIINETDVGNISHYWLRNLEGMVHEELEKYITDDLSKSQIERIINNIYEYIFGEIAKEQYTFSRYIASEYTSILYNKMLKCSDRKNV